MAAEVHGLVPGLEYSFLTQGVVDVSAGRSVNVGAQYPTYYVESSMWFNVVSKDGSMCNRRITSGIFALQESYETG